MNPFDCLQGMVEYTRKRRHFLSAVRRLKFEKFEISMVENVGLTEMHITAMPLIVKTVNDDQKQYCMLNKAALQSSLMVSRCCRCCSFVSGG